jgi:nephrocystin-3
MQSSGSAPDPSQDRQIRVFISSTFLDMKAERDHLLRFIFPKLRRLCEERAVTWDVVDLRWGVTDEETAEGQVLPICLEEIRRCRPYFIGLLGERYGWVPDSIPEELIREEPWLKEQVRNRKSVTELEILHGVLRNKRMAKHAYFYFRDPVYVRTIPKQHQADFLSESPENARKLQELKKSICKSGFPVRENYPSPEALGDLVLEDMTAVINRLYPQDVVPTIVEREAMDHEAYARSRAQIYIGRQEYFDRLDAHAASNSEHPLVILGESGSGKSALLANWAFHYRELHPDVPVIQHYIGASPHSAQWAPMLQCIMAEWKRLTGVKEDTPGDPDKVVQEFTSRWLPMAAAKGRTILILDALNQLEDLGGASSLGWLPWSFPANVRLFVSTLPGRSQDEVLRRSWPVFHVQPLELEERIDLIGEALAERGKNLSPERAHRIATTPSASNPLFLRVLIDELCIFGEHEELDERIDHYLEAPSPYELYEKVIIRWEDDYEGESDLVGDALSLLWASRRGLSEMELMEALGENGEPLPRAIWSPLYLAMSHGLVNRGGLLTFAHDYLRTAAEDSYVPREEGQRAAYSRIADYFCGHTLSPQCC